MAIKPLPFPVSTRPKVTEQDIMALQSGLGTARDTQVEANRTFEEDLRERLNAALARDLPVDLTPLAALTDQWSGSNFAKSYAPPETFAQRQAEVNALRDRAGAASLDTAELDTNLLKSRLDEVLAGEKDGYGRQMDAFNQNYKERRDLINDEFTRRRVAAAEKRAARGPATIVTPGMRAFDSQAGKMFADFSVGGEGANMVNDIASLRNISQKLMTADSDLSGGLLNNFGEWADFAKNAVNAESTDVRDGARSVAANTIKQVFGGNPTEGEGLRLMKFLYDEKQPPQVNARRLEAFANKAERALQTRQKMYQEFISSGGTLANSNYQIPSVSSIMTELQATEKDLKGKATTQKAVPQTSTGRITGQDLEKMTRAQKIEALKQQQGGN